MRLYSLILVCFILHFNAAHAYRTLAIDLGTTFSRVGILENGKLTLVQNEDESTVTPTYLAVSVDSPRNYVIGTAAKAQLKRHPESVITNIKGFLGKQLKDVDPATLQYLPFSIPMASSKLQLQVLSYEERTKAFTPDEVMAAFLNKLKVYAAANLDITINQAVITIPSIYNQAQRQALIKAGTKAGLQVHLLSDTSAVGVTIAKELLKKKVLDPQIFLIFSMGGGTTTASLVEILDGNVYILAHSGDNNLGGQDFDFNLVKHFIQLYKEKYGKDISGNKKTIEKLKLAIERGKQSLTGFKETRLLAENFFGGEDLSETLTRETFEELNMPLFIKAAKLVEDVFEKAKISPNQVNKVVFVGGSSKIPKLREIIQDYLGDIKEMENINEDEAVIEGAALVAKLITEEDDFSEYVPILERYPFQIRFNETVLFIANSQFPVTMSKVFEINENEKPSTVPIYEGDEIIQTLRIKKSNKEAKMNLTLAVDSNGVFTVSWEEAGNEPEIEAKVEAKVEADDGPEGNEMDHESPSYLIQSLVIGGTILAVAAIVGWMINRDINGQGAKAAVNGRPKKEKRPRVQPDLPPMTDMPAEVPDRLRCPVCKDFPDGKVFQCRNGHVICEACYAVNSECPNCHNRFGNAPIRSLHTEEMLAAFIAKCPFKNEGCELKLLRLNLQEHIEVCPFNSEKYGPNRFICNMIGFPNCPFRANKNTVTSVLDHLCNNHKASHIKNTCVSLEFPDANLLSTSSASSASIKVWKPIVFHKDGDSFASIFVAGLHPDMSLSLSGFYLPLNFEQEWKTAIEFELKSDNYLNCKGNLVNILEAKEGQMFPRYYQARSVLASDLDSTTVTLFIGKQNVIEGDMPSLRLEADQLTTLTQIKGRRQATKPAVNAEEEWQQVPLPQRSDESGSDSDN